MRDYEHKSEIAELRTRNEVLERQLAQEIQMRKDSDEMREEWKKRAEQAEQRIAESRRQKPAAWMAHIPQVGGTYSVHLQEEKHHPLGVAWEEPLYAAPIVPPTVEEAVKAELLEFKDRLGEIDASTTADPATIKVKVNLLLRSMLDAIRARSGK